MRETELTFQWCAECAETVLFEVVDADTLACGGCGFAVWAAFPLVADDVAASRRAA